MDFEIDEHILIDFTEQVSKEEERLKEINSSLQSNSSQSELFEEAGQIADRIYGAVAMFQIETFANYCKKMKEVSYKTSKTESDHDIARKKCLNLIVDFREDLIFIKNNISEAKQILLKDRHFKTMIGRADKLLNSYLHSIDSGSCAFEDDQKFVFIYDKSAKLEMFYKQLGKQIFPAPKFFNALQGFKRTFDKERESVYGIVFDTSDDCWMEHIKFIRTFDPLVPIIVSSRNKRGVDKLDLKKLQIQGFVVLSNGNLSKVMERFEKVYGARDSVIPAHDPDIVKTASDISQNAQDYIAVSTKVFKSDLPSPFDVFLKVASKFVKVIKKDEPFDMELVERHIDKGVEKYFINKQEHEEFLALLDQEVKSIYENPEIGFSEKRDTFMDYADDISHYLEEKGLDNESMAQAVQFVQTSENLVSAACEEYTGLKELMSGITDLEHSASVCFLAGLFLKYINAKSSIYNDIALACFLHDVGLVGHPDVVVYGMEDLMDEDEKKIFYNHPKNGALKLAELGVKPALVEAVRQHHIYFDGTGFPKLKNGEVLSPIAEVIALANDFLDVIEQAEENEDPVVLFQQDGLQHFSPKIQNVFNYAFK